MKKNKKYDLAVAYRIYPKVSSKPPIFRNNKFKLANFCLKSFKASLGDLKVKIWALLDGCNPEYNEIFRKYFDDEDLEIVELNRIGNKATFGIQLKILLEQNFSDIVYFAEDDFYYFPNQFRKMIDFLKNNAVVDFVSVYDHLDLYTIEFHKYKSYIKTYDDKHWRTINSTTCTFLTTKNVLIKTKNIFKKYSKKNFFDRDIFKKNRILRHLFLDFFGRATGADYWSSLTKINIFKLFRILKFRYRNYGTWQIYFRSWRYNWRQILFGRKYYLWAPIPTIGTHMEYNFLPPTIDWDKIFKKEISEL